MKCRHYLSTATVETIQTCCFSGYQFQCFSLDIFLLVMPQQKENYIECDDKRFLIQRYKLDILNICTIMVRAQNIEKSTLEWKMLHVHIGIIMVLTSCSEGKTSIISTMNMYQRNVRDSHLEHCIDSVTGLTCPDNKFACRDETRCIPIWRFCDGSKDCR